jgi:hypothetical protein
VRPQIEGLEQRLALSVSTSLSGGQLLISTNNSDDVTLDHSGSFTFVNETAIPDAAITQGIQIEDGFSAVNIRATVKAVTADGESGITVGKAGNMQGILAPLSLGSDLSVTLDDSLDPIGRNVTMNVLNGVVSITGITGLPTATISFNESGGLFGDDLLRLTINGGSGGNTFNILNTPAAFEFLVGNVTETVLNAGIGNDTVNVLANSSSLLEIQAQTGSNTVNIGNGNLQGIQERVDVLNSRFTSLFVNGSAATSPQNVTMSVAGGFGKIVGLAPAEINYQVSSVGFMDVKAGSGGNTFTIEDTFRNGTTSNITRIDTGTGLDQVFVHRATGNLEIDGQNGGDLVNIGSALFPGGSLLGIQGNITITNQFSRTALFVNGAADAFPHTVTLAASGTLGEIRGLASGVIFYTPNDIRGINLNSGAGPDTFFVTSTAAPAPLTINGLGGDDTFIVGNSSNTLDEIRTPLTLNGNSGFDTLIVNDQGSTIGHFYGATTSTVTRQIGNTVTVNYSGIESLQLNRSTVPIVFGTDPFFAPQVKNLAFPKSIRAGRFAALSGRLVDRNKGDKLSLAVDWGDGSAPDQSAPNRRPFSRKHIYAKAGTYIVRAIWTDSTGQSNFLDLTLTVTPSHPRLSPFRFTTAHHGVRRSPAASVML